nr:HipA N-terminal domain-containing protein [Delftia sp.]
MAALGVWMNGERVGTWEVTRTGRHVFAYDPAWPQVRMRGRCLSMPFTRDLTVAGEVAHYFDNLLPDGGHSPAHSPALRAARDRCVFAAGGHWPRLRGCRCSCCPRADARRFDQVRFEPLSEAQLQSTWPAWVAGLAALEVDQEFRLSIAGAQEKTAVLRHGSQWCRPLVRRRPHILKPAIGVVPLALRPEQVDGQWWLAAPAGRAGLCRGRQHRFLWRAAGAVRGAL